MPASTPDSAERALANDVLTIAKSFVMCREALFTVCAAYPNDPQGGAKQAAAESMCGIGIALADVAAAFGAASWDEIVEIIRPHFDQAKRLLAESRLASGPTSNVREWKGASDDEKSALIEEAERALGMNVRNFAVSEEPTPGECPVCSECGARHCAHSILSNYHLWTASKARAVDGGLMQTMERCSKCEKTRPVLSAPLVAAPEAAP